jgi:3-phytase
VNNVDLRYNFPLAGERVTLVTASNRSTNSIGIYRVDVATRALVNVAARLITSSPEPYGLCMYHSPASGKYFVLTNTNAGDVRQWELSATAAGMVDATEVRSFDAGGITEGCVADDELGQLYIGEEDVAIWKYGAEPSAGSARRQVDSVDGGRLDADIEGLTLYHAGSAGGGYLIASSQGSDAFALYERGGTNAYVATFRIAEGAVDRVSGTDGIDVTNASLGSAFPRGVFVAQDNTNNDGNQNFKLVPWDGIARSASPALSVDTSWDPRAVGR